MRKILCVIFLMLLVFGCGNKSEENVNSKSDINTEVSGKIVEKNFEVVFREISKDKFEKITSDNYDEALNRNDITQKIKNGFYFFADNGKRIEFVGNEDIGESMEVYSYIGQYKDLPIYIVEASYFGYASIILINKVNGMQVAIDGTGIFIDENFIPPIISPDKKSFFIISCEYDESEEDATYYDGSLSTAWYGINKNTKLDEMWFTKDINILPIKIEEAKLFNGKIYLKINEKVILSLADHDYLDQQVDRSLENDLTPTYVELSWEKSGKYFSDFNLLNKEYLQSDINSCTIVNGTDNLKVEFNNKCIEEQIKDSLENYYWESFPRVDDSSLYYLKDFPKEGAALKKRVKKLAEELKQIYSTYNQEQMKILKERLK